MLSTSTSDPTRPEKLRPGQHGFSAIELLVGLSLTVCLALAISPVWVGLQGRAAGRADRSVAVVQSRVAVARLERDLRLARATGCRFEVAGPVLEASPFQVVFLGAGADGSEPVLVEWELSNGSLMRRWGACPPARPQTFVHSLYDDHKTMLEQTTRESVFRYVVDGELTDGPVPFSRLTSIDAVVVSLCVQSPGSVGTMDVTTWARVAR